MTKRQTSTEIPTPLDIAEAFELDVSPASAVVVCGGCGWRGLAIGRDQRATRLSAWRQADGHERRAHPDRRQAADALWAALDRRDTPVQRTSA